MALAGALGIAGAASAQCGTTVGNPTDGLVTTITTDTTWGDGSNPGPICLEEPIYVSGGARLTIVPGTIVRGQPRRGATGSLNNNPGALIITKGSQLNADGTATSPIVMTTAAVDNDNDGVCDNLDQFAAGPPAGAAFKDPYPGLDPNSPAGCAATRTCTTACTGGCTPTFCDDTPLTAPLAPLDRAGLANVQLWGGLALAGGAPINLADDAGEGYGIGLLEGVQLPQTPASLAVYGGFEPHDNTGTIRYVSVRHAGDPLTQPGDELNGVTLAGIGDGTIYEFVEVYANWDDGHEWFGGTVNGNHLVTMYAGDDQFDIDQGYTGALQYLFTTMPFFQEEGTGGGDFGSGSGDRMGEWDGVDGSNVNMRRDADGDTDGAPWPFPYSQVWNLTGIGSTPDGTNPSTATNDNKRGLFMRNGFAGAVANSIVVNTGTRSCFEIDPSTATAPTGYNTPDNNNNDLIRLISSICADTAAPNATSVANGDAYAERETGSTTLGDNVITASDVLVREDPDFNPRGDTDGKLRSTMQGGVLGYDPRPTGTEVGIQPQDSGLDRAGTYRGAFEAGATELWTTPWTAGNIGGILAD